MHRQTLATREKVLGEEHPDTLTSVYCLAHLLANQYRNDESAALYERACAGYSGVLGNDRPTTRACYRHYAKMLALREQRQSMLPEILQRQDSGNVRYITNDSLNIQRGKVSGLSRRLAKIGIRRLKV
jgi:Tetratricopeptide repeat